MLPVIIVVEVEGVVEGVVISVQRFESIVTSPSARYSEPSDLLTFILQLMKR